MTIYRHAEDSVVIIHHVLIQCIQFPRIRKGRISYSPSVNIQKHGVFSRSGVNSCGALLGSGCFSFCLPSYDTPFLVPVNGPKFRIDLPQVEGGVCGHRIMALRNSVNVQKTASFLVWGGIIVALSSVAGARPPPLRTLPVQCLSMVPSFASIARTSREEFANKGFWLYEIIYIYIYIYIICIPTHNRNSECIL